MIHAINYSNSYKYFHFHLNTFSHYLSLLPRESLQILVVMIHAITYSNSYKYFHFHLNTFSHYLSLLPRIEVYFNPILKFMI